jgi:hypothetical protein
MAISKKERAGRNLPSSKKEVIKKKPVTKIAENSI